MRDHDDTGPLCRKHWSICDACPECEQERGAATLRAEYAALEKERDERIAELVGEVVQANERVQEAKRLADLVVAEIGPQYEGMKARVEAAERALRERDEQCNHAIRVNREEVGQAAYDRALADIGYTISVGMIAAERRRQVEGESWNSQHDDGHTEGQLACAAACYALESAGLASQHYRLGRGGIEVNVDARGIYWPFESAWWKPRTPICNLVKAGALIAAEIDRRLRAGEEP